MTQNSVRLIVAANLALFTGTIFVIAVIVAGGKWNEPDIVHSRQLPDIDELRAEQQLREQRLIETRIKDITEAKLTDQERAKRLLPFVKLGMTSDEVAQLFGIDPKGVKADVSSTLWLEHELVVKFDKQNRVESARVFADLFRKHECKPPKSRAHEKAVRAIINSDREPREKGKLLLPYIKPGMDCGEVKGLLGKGPDYSTASEHRLLHMYSEYGLAVSFAIENDATSVTSIDLIGARLTAQMENEMKAIVDSKLKPKEKGKRLLPYLKPGIDINEVMRLLGEGGGSVTFGSATGCCTFYSQYELSISYFGDVMTSADSHDAE